MRATSPEVVRLDAEILSVVDPQVPDPRVPVHGARGEHEPRVEWPFDERSGVDSDRAPLDARLHDDFFGVDPSELDSPRTR